MANRKGAELSLNFIIIAAIVLVVLIVAILFFTGGASKLIGEQKEIQRMSEQERSLALASCKFACTMKDESKFNNPGFSETVVSAGFSKCIDFPEIAEMGSTFDMACNSECVKTSGAITTNCGAASTKADCDAKGADCKWQAKA
ncbi:MAG: hypothetical protein PHO02_02150 [Candidatus Nanoarchaeia archaeon]|nr:hypothetical protein [Candidatus Nanoarchaeia archaeon]